MNIVVFRSSFNLNREEIHENMTVFLKTNMQGFFYYSFVSDMSLRRAFCKRKRKKQIFFNYSTINKSPQGRKWDVGKCLKLGVLNDRSYIRLSCGLF